jgi:WhiB family transcriptional regulator, redox-sensing transcriptional regulator
MPLDNAVASAEWMSRGACQREDPELFFPISDGAAHLAAAAKAVCEACPVRASCLAFAVETRQDGSWGGTTSDERRAMRIQASQRRGTGRTVSARHACRYFPKVPAPGCAKADTMNGVVRCRVMPGITTVTAAGGPLNLWRGSPDDR